MERGAVERAASGLRGACAGWTGGPTGRAVALGCVRVRRVPRGRAWLWGRDTVFIRVGAGLGWAGLNHGDVTKRSNGAAWGASESGPCGGRNVTTGAWP